MRVRTVGTAGRAWALVLTVAVAASCTAAPASELVPTPGSVGPTEQPFWPRSPQRSLDEATTESLQETLDDWLGTQDAPGATAAVVAADGAWSGAAGVDGNGTALRPDSAGAIASITKTFVAAEIMQLANRGRIDLDEAVGTYVDLPFDDDGATVRQVLGMESGFPLDPIDTVRGAAADPDQEWTARQVLDLTLPGTTQGTLGGEPNYNNVNYWVLGLLVEQVTGGPVATALRQDLVTPAGLDRAWFQTSEQPEAPLAIPATEQGEPPVDHDGPFLPSRAMASASGAAGGMAADAPSLASWGHLLYGGHVIDASLVEEMTASSGEDEWYGLGTMLWDVDGEQVVGHGGDIGVYHSLLSVWPSGTSIAVLVPAPWPDTFDEDRTIFGLTRSLHAVATG